MDFYHLLISSAMIAIMGAMMPGPDMMLVARNSLLRHRSAGYFTALGIACSTSIHITYCLLGIAVLISQSTFLFYMVKYLGAAYLISLGVKTILDSKRFAFINQSAISVGCTHFQSFREGFLTNLLNPNMTLFFLAIFTSFLDPHLPLNTESVFASEFIFLPFLWYCLLATFFAYPLVRTRFMRLNRFLPFILGFVIIGFVIAIILAPK